MVLEAYNLSKEAGEAMKQLQLKYAQVSISYTLDKQTDKSSSPNENALSRNSLNQQSEPSNGAEE